MTVLPPSRPDFTSAAWRKSSYSGDTACVETAQIEDAIGVRDSKNKAGAVLPFTTTGWDAFLHATKTGTFIA